MDNSALDVLTPEQLAERWGYSVRTLTNWRSLNKGCSFSKIGDMVVYRLQAVRDYEERQLHKVG